MGWKGIAAILNNSLRVDEISAAFVSFLVNTSADAKCICLHFCIHGIIKKQPLSGKIHFSAIFCGFFADFRNLKYARDCRRMSSVLQRYPKSMGVCTRRGREGDRRLRLFSCPLVASPDAKPAATRKIKSHRKQKSRKKRKESRLPPRLCENRRLQKSNQANAIIPESHAAAH